MRLRVCYADREDVYRDVVRVAEQYRKDSAGRTIEEGSVCKVKVGQAEAFGLLRGLGNSSTPEIRLDERIRNILGVAIGQEVEIVLSKVGFRGQLRWAWSASDPSYRIAARLAVLSVLLGFLGLGLGALSLYLTW